MKHYHLLSVENNPNSLDYKQKLYVNFKHLVKTDKLLMTKNAKDAEIFFRWNAEKWQKKLIKRKYFNLVIKKF